MESQNFDVLKNFGISSTIFNYKAEDIAKRNVYVIKQEKIKKNFSDGAIHKIPSSISFFECNKAKDDMDLYWECDQEYGILCAEADVKKFHNNFGFFGSASCNDFNYSNNGLNSKKNLNLVEDTKFDFAAKYFLNGSLKANSTSFNSLRAIEHEENQDSDKAKEAIYKNKNNNFNLKNISNKPITSSNLNLVNEQNQLNQKNLNSSKFTERNKNYFKQIAKIQKEKSETDEKSNSTTKNDFNKNNNNNHKNNPEENLFKNGIFKDSMRNQMQQLDKIFQEMNESSETKVIIKAYKSKLKTKFFKIYESNSEFYKEINKYKIFHKCNFPGCSRTFASAGWLKIHFNEHLKEIQNNKFNVEFEKSLMKLKHMNLLN